MSRVRNLRTGALGVCWCAWVGVGSLGQRWFTVALWRMGEQWLIVKKKTLAYWVKLFVLGANGLRISAEVVGERSLRGTAIALRVSNYAASKCFV